jgi:predicted nucleic acid-binding protein
MALGIYLDTSAMVSLFVSDRFSDTAAQVLESNRQRLWSSDFGAAEFLSAISRLARIGTLTRANAEAAFAAFEDWVDTSTIQAYCERTDIKEAMRVLKRMDLALRAPDAIHLAVARRLDAALLTFDDRLRAAAATLGGDLAHT